MLKSASTQPTTSPLNTYSSVIPSPGFWCMNVIFKYFLTTLFSSPLLRWLPVRGAALDGKTTWWLADHGEANEFNSLEWKDRKLSPSCERVTILHDIYRQHSRDRTLQVASSELLVWGVPGALRARGGVCTRHDCASRPGADAHYSQFSCLGKAVTRVTLPATSRSMMHTFTYLLKTSNLRGLRVSEKKCIEWQWSMCWIRIVHGEVYYFTVNYIDVRQTRNSCWVPRWSFDAAAQRSCVLAEFGEIYQEATDLSLKEAGNLCARRNERHVAPSHCHLGTPNVKKHLMAPSRLYRGDFSSTSK